MTPRPIAWLDRPSGIVVGALIASLLAAAWLRAPCANAEDWRDGRQTERFCYTDIVLLWHQRQLGSRFPYLQQRNEYPVGTGMFMGLAALPVDSDDGFLTINELLLAGCAVISGLLLARLRGSAALFFAASPSLMLYAFLNWDLLPVAFVVVATWAFLHRHDGLAAIALGLGAAAKVFPGFYAVPFAAERLRLGDRRGAAKLVLATAVTWTVVNLPIAVAYPNAWSLFFRYSAERIPHPASLWGIGCMTAYDDPCVSTQLVNVASWALLVGLTAIVWWLTVRRHPGVERWTLGFVVTAAFLLTAKVYSPQYSLWIVPWFVLANARWRAWLPFTIAEVAVFFVEFSVFNEAYADQETRFIALQAAVLVRAAAIVWSLVVFVRNGPTGRTAPQRAPRSAIAAAPT